jgi:hypothetical protein
VDSDEKVRIVDGIIHRSAYRYNGIQWKLEVSFLYSRVSTVRYIESTDANRRLNDLRSFE